MSTPINLNKDTDTTGTGTNELWPNWGANLTRETITRTYSAVSGSVVSSNTLTISQPPAALTNYFDTSTGQSANMPSDATVRSFTFKGHANGKYLKYTTTGFTTTVVTEDSNGSDTSVGTSYATVANYNNGEYEYTITVSLAAGVSTGNKTVVVSTSDVSSPSSSQEISVTYTVKVTEQYEAVTDVTIYEDGEEEPLTQLKINVGQTKWLYAEVDPDDATDKSITWSTTHTSNVTLIPATNTQYASIVGRAATSMPIDIWAESDDNASAKDDALVSVFVPGTFTVDDTEVGSASDLAATQIKNASNMVSYDSVTSSESWACWSSHEGYVQNGYVYVPVMIDPFETTRTTTITVTGTDEGGQTITRTFVVTQHKIVVHCTGMDIVNYSGGADFVINNADNQATFNAVYYPNPGCTDTQCTWSLEAGSAYASLSTVNTRAVVTVLPGASGNTITLKATNTYTPPGGQPKSAQVNILVTYVETSALSVSPGSVAIAWDATSDNTPVVTATACQSVYVSQIDGFSGFISSASIVSNRIVTGFDENTSTTNTRAGSVIVTGIGFDNVEHTVPISYTQAIKPAVEGGIRVLGLNVMQNGGKVKMMCKVAFDNPTNYNKTFPAPSFTVTGYADSTKASTTMPALSDTAGSDFTALPNHYGTTADTYTYTSQWTATTNMSEWYTVHVTCGTAYSDDYESDGEDVLI